MSKHSRNSMGYVGNGRVNHVQVGHYDPYEHATWNSRPTPRRRGPGAGLVVGLVALAVLAVALLVLIVPQACSSADPVESPDATPNLQARDAARDAGTYNWSCLVTQNNNRLAYIVGNEKKSRFGIDVSEHQGDIDWQAAAADGVEFAIVRVAVRGTDTGALLKDANFDANMQGAAAAGIPVGVYVFSQAVNPDEAREEAQFALQNLSGYHLDLPVVFDAETLHESESRANNLDTETATANALAFCQVVEDAGYTPMIYGNYDDLNRMDMDQLREYPTWFAAYTELPFGASNFAIWQYSETGTVAGIDHVVDYDIIIDLD